MATKLMHVQVRGKHHQWGFMFYGDPKYLDEWRADGLEVEEVEHVIPEWVVQMHMTTAWCFVQSILHFRNPWR
jgi:hypothetical protein